MRITRTVFVAALGYFVDVYDLILFSVVRAKSLRDLGISEAEMIDRGVLLIDMQMGGMLIGGIVWGVLGDLRGRLSVLFGSIFLYSAANIANGFVDSVPAYAIARFVAGLGLAGEIGAGITLVAELMKKENRGLGTTFVAAVGSLGTLGAVLVADRTDWRTAYWIGGALGLLLLFLRVGLFESKMFDAMRLSTVVRGDFFALFRTRARALKYVATILSGIPLWYVTGILISFSPEIMHALHFEAVKDPSQSMIYWTVGLTAGDVMCGLVSQQLKSRKRALLAFQAVTAIAVALYFGLAPSSLLAFNLVSFLIGFGGGYWAVFVTTAAEQFGTNLRATVATTVPNFIRGSIVPITLLFQLFKPAIGVAESAIVVGAVCFIIGTGSLFFVEETYGKDLDYAE